MLHIYILKWAFYKECRTPAKIRFRITPLLFHNSHLDLSVAVVAVMERFDWLLRLGQHLQGATNFSTIKPGLNIAFYMRRIELPNQGGSIGFLSNDTVQLWATRAPPLSVQQKIKLKCCARERWKFQIGYIHQDLSYHSNEMTPCPILISEIQRRDLGLDIVASTMEKL